MKGEEKKEGLLDKSGALKTAEGLGWATWKLETSEINE